MKDRKSKNLLKKPKIIEETVENVNKVSDTRAPELNNIDHKNMITVLGEFFPELRSFHDSKNN